MQLEQMHHRAHTLHWQLRTFALPASLQTEMRFELEALESAIAQVEREAREAAATVPTPGQAQGQSRLEKMLAVALSDDPFIPVVSKDDIDAFEKNSLTGDKDLERRNKAIIKKLRERGEFRDLRKLPSDWQKRLARLERRFPNFHEAIEYLRASFYANGRRDRSVYASPMLLDGPPGIGKTMFCEELAEAFRLPFARLDMASAQSASGLAGSDIFWANTRPGRVFTEVLLGELANPLFLLDEVDKANGDDRYPALNALYPLLEQRTARRFEDLSFPGIRFNAGHVLWIGTSNNARELDAPILDRMHVFSIEPPSREAMLRMAEEAVDQVLAELRLTRRDVNLGQSALRHLAELPPRAMKRTITESVSLSALRRQKRLQVSKARLDAGRRSMGFV